MICAQCQTDLPEGAKFCKECGNLVAPEKLNRKLTAILSADVKGYSRLMGEDEEWTLRTLNSYKGVIGNLVGEHRGRVVASPGDNVLADFASVVDAVECAVEIQQVLRAKNALLPETRKMDFRIGINLGDVIEEGDSIYGDGVNIAARLEGLADPGGICISESAYQQIENKIPLRYDYLGEHAVKNIAKPVKVYRARIEPEGAPSPVSEGKKPGRKGLSRAVLAVIALVVIAGGALLYQVALRPSAPQMEVASKEKLAFPLPDKPSIAVLPFTNMSSEKKLEYFSEGLVEGIINGLSKSDNIFVVARNSTFTYKDKPVKIKQVAEEMGVRYVMEGSVQQEGNRVRITAQLIDALTGRPLFSERYDRDLEDILNLQDEITMKVLTAVQVKLTGGEGARILEKGTNNLDAYLKLVQARDLKGGTVNKERVERAMQLLEEAIALDPGFSRAYSLLSTAYFDLVLIGASESPRESLQRALELGKKAIALDDSNSGAHSNLTFTYAYLGEYDKAISEAEKAISLSPNSAGAYWALGAALLISGRPQEAIPLLQKSLRLSPIPVHSQVLGALANSYRQLGQYEEAVVLYKKMLYRYGPDHLLAHLDLAVAYALMNREKEARVEGAEVLRIDPKFSIERYVKPMPMDQSKKDKYIELLRKTGLK